MIPNGKAGGCSSDQTPTGLPHPPDPVLLLYAPASLVFNQDTQSCHHPLWAKKQVQRLLGSLFFVAPEKGWEKTLQLDGTTNTWVELPGLMLRVGGYQAVPSLLLTPDFVDTSLRKRGGALLQHR